LENCYEKLAKKRNLEQSLQSSDNSADDLLLVWSQTVEDAVNHTLQIQHKLDPLRHPTPGLPADVK